MPGRILVVEDDRQLRALLGELFVAEGYSVALATDGQDALQQLAETPSDLVLSDVMMPNLDGRGLATAMQADPALRRIPLVLISAGPPSIFAGVACAAALRKPFDIQELLGTVAQALDATAA